MIYWWPRYAHWKKKDAVICLYLISYSIEHLRLYWVYYWGFVRVFHEGFFCSLSHFRYTVGWMRVFHEIFKFCKILCFLDQSCCTLQVWELSNLSLRSLNQCLPYYSIMGDMIYLCCIDIRCSSFLFTFSLPSFDFPSFFSYYLFHFRSIPTPIHLPNLTHFFTSFTLFVDGLTTSPSFSFHSQHLHRLLLSSHAHETLTRCTLWVWSLGIWA